MGEVIDMISCPYCLAHIVAEEELVCERCVDKVHADLACADILNGMCTLEEVMLSETHLAIVKQVIDRLNKLIRDGDGNGTFCG